MPSSTSSTTTTTTSTDLLRRLASTDGVIRLKALREVKNQIIGNRTKKLSYIKIGVVPAVAAILSESNDVSSNDHHHHHLIVQAAAALGSFACGVDAGVQAVLDAGAFTHLLRLLSNPDEKVMDAGARSLRMIYHSKLAPKYDFLEEKHMEFLLSLLNSENENVTGLGASIITHSCKTTEEQKTLCHSGVLKKLIRHLKGSLSQRDASLESIATIVKNNPEVAPKFVGTDSGKSLSYVIELTDNRYPRTRLLACVCLTVIRNTSPCYLHDIGIKSKLIVILLELLDDPGQVGDEAPFALSSLIAEKEDMQKLAFEANAIDKLYNHLQKGSLHPKCLQGLLLALSELCSKLESCRSRFLSLQVLNFVIDALADDCTEVRTAACICLKNVSRSVKSLSAGQFMNEMTVIPLLRLLHDPQVSVQVAALGAISNMVVDFATDRATFTQCGGVKLLVQLSKSVDSTVRLNTLWALRNLMFLAEDRCKEGIFLELSVSALASLICDPDAFVQEQALALVRNLVDGCIDFIDYVFAEDCIILDTVGRQMQSALSPEIGIQGMYVLCNVASGNEFHKEAVMHRLLPQEGSDTHFFLIKFLQSNDSRLRTVTVWVVINLTIPSSPGAFNRFSKLRNAGVFSQLKNMVNDPCIDAKLRVRTALGNSMTLNGGSS